MSVMILDVHILLYHQDEHPYRIQENIVNTGIERTNLFYGSTDPEVTHLVSVHGTVDPWHPLGVLEDINPLAPVIVVEGK